MKGVAQDHTALMISKHLWRTCYILGTTAQGGIVWLSGYTSGLQRQISTASSWLSHFGHVTLFSELQFLLSEKWES